MRFYLIVVLMVMLVGCGTPMTKTGVLWNGTSLDAVDKMLFTLEDLGYDILNVHKADGIILAQKVTTVESFGAMGSSQSPKPFKVSISVHEQGEKVLLNITITQPGEFMSPVNETKMLTNKIINKFKEYAGEIEIVSY